MDIYHIAYADDWAKASEEGDYRISTRGRTLDQQGFIHAATSAQVALVANTYYSDDDNLIVLVIDPTRLTCDLKFDPVPGSDEPYPHIYGPLNLDAVTATVPLERDDDGRYFFTVPPR